MNSEGAPTINYFDYWKEVMLCLMLSSFTFESLYILILLSARVMMSSSKIFLRNIVMHCIIMSYFDWKCQMLTIPQCLWCLLTFVSKFALHFKTYYWVAIYLPYLYVLLYIVYVLIFLWDQEIKMPLFFSFVL